MKILSRICSNQENKKNSQEARNGLTSALLDAVCSLGMYLAPKIGECELVPTIAALWNARQLYETQKKLEQGIRKKTRRLHPANKGKVLLFAHSTGWRPLPHAKSLQATEELIKRCHLYSIAYGIRVFKISAILFPQPFRTGVEGICNTTAHSSLLKLRTTTVTPRNIVTSQVTRKDTAHLAFKTAVEAIGVIQGAFAIVYSFGYVEEKNRAYQMIIFANLVSSSSNFIYLLLQRCGFFALRE